MGNAAVIFLNNPPKCNCSFLYGKKETLAKGKDNAYNNLLGNVLNNHILSTGARLYLYEPRPQIFYTKFDKIYYIRLCDCLPTLFTFV